MNFLDIMKEKVTIKNFDSAKLVRKRNIICINFIFVEKCFLLNFIKLFNINNGNVLKDVLLHTFYMFVRQKKNINAKTEFIIEF